MAITTYAELQTAIINWCARENDTLFSVRVPEFISLAEARMNRKIELLGQMSEQTINSSSEFTDLPTDPRRITYARVSAKRPLQSMTNAALLDKYSNDESGRPQAYAILGSQIRLRPIPDTSYTVTLGFGTGISELSDSNTSNAILADHPDVYFDAALEHAYAYLEDADQELKYRNKADAGMGEIDMQLDMVRFGGALTMTTDYRRA